jgi:hypothetical protein
VDRDLDSHKAMLDNLLQDEQEIMDAIQTTK